MLAERAPISAPDPRWDRLLYGIRERGGVPQGDARSSPFPVTICALHRSSSLPSAASSPPSSSPPRRTSSTSGPRANRRSASAPSCGSRMAGRTVYGVVTDGFAYSDLVTPMHAVIGADGDPVAVGARADARAPRSGCSPPRCCARSPRSRSSRCRSARSGSRRCGRACSRSAWTPTPGASGPPAFRSASTPPAASSRRSISTADFLLGPGGRPPEHHRRLGLATKTSAVEFLLAQHLPDFPGAQGSRRGGLLQREGPRPLLPRPAGEISPSEDRRAVRTARARRRSRSSDVRYFAPFKADGVNLNTLRTQRGAAAQHRAAGVGPARGAGLRRGGAQPRRHRRQGGRVHRFPRPSAWWAASSRTRCCAASRSRCRASRTSRSSSGRSSISWRRWAGAARCGARITSRPSGRCETA